MEIEVKELRCVYCNSLDLVRYGKRNNKQIYKCSSCNKKFVDNIFDQKLKMKSIARVFEYHSDGLSSRDISKKIKEEFGYDITHNTVCNWLKKFDLNEDIYEISLSDKEKLLFSIRTSFESLKNAWTNNHSCFDKFFKSLKDLLGEDVDQFIDNLYISGFEEFLGMGEGNPSWEDLLKILQEFEKEGV